LVKSFVTALITTALQGTEALVSVACEALARFDSSMHSATAHPLGRRALCLHSSPNCTISALQGTGALVKAHVMHALNSSSRHLSSLYRLVKLWAQAHDLNDASRSTFNSTSLL
jgi:hypothetical protein